MALARSMHCRPSEVLEEDETDVDLWLLWDNAEAAVAERQRKDLERERARQNAEASRGR